MKYFAYGSNLNHSQMHNRCPSSTFLKRVKLNNYQLVFDGFSGKWKGAVANIVKCHGEYVWGGLFKINKDNKAALNCYEGYPQNYDCEEVSVVDDSNNVYIAITYCRFPREVGYPSAEYLDVIIRGTHDCLLPSDYIAKLKSVKTISKFTGLK